MKTNWQFTIKSILFCKKYLIQFSDILNVNIISAKEFLEKDQILFDITNFLNYKKK